MTASSRRLSVGNRSVCGLFRCCCVAVVLLLLLSLSLVAVSIGTVEASVDPSVRLVAAVSFGRKKSTNDEAVSNKDDDDNDIEAKNEKSGFRLFPRRNPKSSAKDEEDNDTTEMEAKMEKAGFRLFPQRKSKSIDHDEEKVEEEEKANGVNAKEQSDDTEDKEDAVDEKDKVAEQKPIFRKRRIFGRVREDKPESTDDESDDAEETGEMGESGGSQEEQEDDAEEADEEEEEDEEEEDYYDDDEEEDETEEERKARMRAMFSQNLFGMPPRRPSGPGSGAMHPQQQPQQSGSSLIILGGQQGQDQGRSVSQLPPVVTIVAGAVATLVSTYLRLWMMANAGRWFSDNGQKAYVEPVQMFVWERLNDVYRKDTKALQTVLDLPPDGVGRERWRWQIRKRQVQEFRQARKAQRKASKDLMEEPKQKHYIDTAFNNTTIVFELSTSQSESLDLSHLEEVVSFILQEHRRKSFGSSNGKAKELEVVVLLTSPGGGVFEFGLAAAQIHRLSREAGITTTVCVDIVAASGGYMIASQADRVVAAPFAVVGSIGVVLEFLNFHDSLGKVGAEPIMLKSGRDKYPLSQYARVTKDNRQTAQAESDKFHAAFHELVVRGRPVLADSIQSIGQGATYFGEEAIELNLVDQTMTSSEYSWSKIEGGDRVLKLNRVPPKVNTQVFVNNFAGAIRERASRWMTKANLPMVVAAVSQTPRVVSFVHQLFQARGPGGLS